MGSSLALGGHAGYLGTQMLQGALSYIRLINGFCCKKLLMSDTSPFWH
ncbi:MAG: hypothetical protein HUK40_23115 [Desulfobacter sp.]|nr:hypothetical protein [Desulfobacter sp.]